MKKNILVAALLLLGISSALRAQESKPPKKAVEGAKTTTVVRGERPKPSPGWIIIEEDWIYPLRFDSLTSLNNARMHYRNSEEKAAASELRRAVSWLELAASHALPVTKSKLTTAAKELSVVAKDLDAGRLADASRLDISLGKASNALAEWHYFKAKEDWAKNEEKYAAQDLEAAVAHLQHAANSAHHEYGPDTMTIFSEVTKKGVTTSETKTMDHNLLGKHLDAIEKAIKEMDSTLMKVSSK